MLQCPYCQGLTKPLPMLNLVSVVEFFQCEGCARISERPKGTAGDPLPLLITFAIAQPRATIH